MIGAFGNGHDDSSRASTRLPLVDAQPAHSVARHRLFATTIGVTGALFAVVDAIMLRPLAMRAPDRTVVIWQRDNARSTPVVEAAYGEIDT